MSQFLIQQYLNNLSDLRKASGTTREGVVSEAFKDLLKGYGKSHDLIFIPQYELPKQDGNPKLSGPRNNVFGIQTGVAISFLVKRRMKKGEAHTCTIHYARRPEMETAEDKLSWLDQTRSSDLSFETVRPDRKANWINQTDNDFETFIAAASKSTKSAKNRSGERAIFKLMSNGIVSARDEWTTGFTKSDVAKKFREFCKIYSSERDRWVGSAERKEAIKKKNKSARSLALRNFVSREIKWTEELERHLDKGDDLTFNQKLICIGQDRPFVALPTYFARIATHRIYQQDAIFPIGKEVENVAIGFSGLSSSKPFQVISVNRVPSFDLLEKVDELDEYDRAIFDDGQVLILKELHDKIDVAVAEAYGWPADLSDDEILAKLVALNKERSDEERCGLVRWLRPDYQIPRFAKSVDKQATKEEGAQVAAELLLPETAQKPAFPSGAVEQTAAVFAALAAAGGPLNAQAIAGQFRKTKTTERKVGDVLASLARLGHVTSPDGKTFSLRRAA